MTYHSEIQVPIPTAQFLELAAFLKAEGSDRDPVDVISTALAYWMDNANWKQDMLLPETIALKERDIGYLWKDLFLPNGTALRMKYAREWHYAAVDKDQVVYKNKKVSPSELCRLITGTSRNAWRDIWIKRPADTDWIQADNFRKED